MADGLLGTEREERLKTTFIIEQFCESSKLILKHKKDVIIAIELRVDHQLSKARFDDAFENNMVRYIVFKVPHSYHVASWDIMDGRQKMAAGYRVTKYADYTELTFYYNFNFIWEVRKLKRLGIMTDVIQRELPDKKNGILFPRYINANCLYQCLYNIVFGLIQLPWFLTAQKRKDEMFNVL